MSVRQTRETEIDVGLNRRDFLGAAACSVPLGLSMFGIGSVLGAGKEPAGRGGLIPRQKNPDNFEFPFAGLRSFITPNDLFYVRNHFPQPKVDRETWRLKVEGAVAKELELTYDDLRKLPRRTEVATLECAGNNRAYLSPKAKGVQWELGAVSNARWTGVSLSTVLERAGMAGDAIEVVLEGTDKGEIGADPRPMGPIHFARSLPLAKARKPEVLLAYEMNGAELPPAHGFPLRAIVPGWFGVASIKWLKRIVLTKKPFLGFFQTVDYSTFEVSKGLADVVPITETQVKAEIALPRAGETIAAGSAYRAHGAAWTGESDVVKVEVSADNGRTWHEARLLDKPVRHAWRLWEYAWRAPKAAGSVKLVARATDARGRVQPGTRDPNRRNYMINEMLPIQVTIE